MMTIYAMVNAEKEGQIESKMMKAVSLSFHCTDNVSVNSLLETTRRN